MIAFRTQIKLKSTTIDKDIWKCFCDWTISSKRNRSFALVDFCTENLNQITSFNKDFDGGPSKEKLISYVEENAKLYCIVFTQEFENGNIYKTSIVYNKNIEYLSFEVDVENKKTGIRPPFSRPNFFKFLKPFIDVNDIPEGYISSEDLNKEELAEIISGKKKLLFPVVYISTTSDSSYIYTDEELNELAKKLYCIAYVIKEADYETSVYLKKHTDGLNVYNGAVGVYWENKKSTYFEDTNIEKLSDKVIRKLSLTPLRKELSSEYVALRTLETTLTNVVHDIFKPENIQKMLDKISEAEKEKKEKEIENQKKIKEEAEHKLVFEQLQEKVKDLEIQNLQLQKSLNTISKELEKKLQELDIAKGTINKKESEYDQLWKDYIDDDKKNTDRIQDLKDNNKGLLEKIEELKGKLSNYEHNWKNTDITKEKSITISVACEEKELFPGEISAYLEGLLWQAFEKSKKITKSIREEHVLKTLLSENKNFDFEKTDNFRHYEQIKDSIKKNFHSPEYKDAHDGKHSVKYYYGDSRYLLTEPKTSSNDRASKNLCSDAERHFLIPNIKKN